MYIHHSYIRGCALYINYIFVVRGCQSARKGMLVLTSTLSLPPSAPGRLSVSREKNGPSTDPDIPQPLSGNGLYYFAHAFPRDPGDWPTTILPTQQHAASKITSELVWVGGGGEEKEKDGRDLATLICKCLCNVNF